MATHDVEWLKSTGWPLISGVAKYYASRATPADNHALGAGLIFKDASRPDESGELRTFLSILMTSHIVLEAECMTDIGCCSGND